MEGMPEKHQILKKIVSIAIENCSGKGFTEAEKNTTCKHKLADFNNFDMRNTTLYQFKLSMVWHGLQKFNMRRPTLSASMRKLMDRSRLKLHTIKDLL